MDIQTLERAADAVLAPPNEVGESDRKMAESMFQNLKNENYPLDHYIAAMRKPFYLHLITCFRPNKSSICSV